MSEKCHECLIFNVLSLSLPPLPLPLPLSLLSLSLSLSLSHLLHHLVVLSPTCNVNLILVLNYYLFNVY